MIYQKKILIIDDDKELVDLLKIFLTGNGYNIECAFDGQQGVKEAKSFEPDLVLLDFIMPSMDGGMTFSAIQEIFDNKMPTIFLTGTKLKLSPKVVDERICKYVRKPFDFPDLLDMIKRVFENVQNANQSRK